MARRRTGMTLIEFVINLSILGAIAFGGFSWCTGDDVGCEFDGATYTEHHE